MMEYPPFKQSDTAIIGLFAEQRVGRLVTIDETGWPRIGVHVYTHDGLTIDVHLVRHDPQLADLHRDPRVVFEVDEILASAPSHWVDEDDATHADQFYRFAAIRGNAEIIDAPEAIAEHLRQMLDRHQPERRYVQLATNHPLYAPHLIRLSLVRIRPDEVHSKFKLGQRTSAAARDLIIKGLRARGSALDHRTADLVRAAATE